MEKRSAGPETPKCAPIGVASWNDPTYQMQRRSKEKNGNLFAINRSGSRSISSGELFRAVKLSVCRLENCVRRQSHVYYTSVDGVFIKRLVILRHIKLQAFLHECFCR